MAVYGTVWVECDVDVAWPKGFWESLSTTVVFTEEVLVRRLVALIPSPRANQVHYHGVLAGRHRWKARIAARRGRIAPRNKSRKLLRGPQRRTRHLAWAALL